MAKICFLGVYKNPIHSFVKKEKHGDGSSAYIQKKYPAQGRTTISYKGGYEKG